MRRGRIQGCVGIDPKANTLNRSSRNQERCLPSSRVCVELGRGINMVHGTHNRVSARSVSSMRNGVPKSYEGTVLDLGANPP